ncbi:phasin family protein [Halorhodospira neutriphila]|uniref:Phasin family protein n=1 Tax=Halorhodospira neutriphila TaxID=168379 RepID=A0ABS1E8W4_9GAMM|nr:phasin family protein [Halorhodospira neutriphila]MBK1727184.1 phasin family protein [Halorhodospira neutriphila]
MQEQLNQSTQQLQKALEPTRKLNALLLDHTEKLIHLNLDAARSYTALAMEQMRSALEIRDPEALQGYLNSQTKVAQTVGNRLSQDTNAIAELSKEMGEQVQQIAQENVSALTEAVQQPQQAQQQARRQERSTKARSGSASAGGSSSSSTASAGSTGGSASSGGSSKKSA